MTGRGGVAALALSPLALLLCGALLRTPELPQTFPDSSSYLLWQPERSSGYPALLSAVRAFDPSLRALPLVQLTLFAGAALLLAEACRYATGSLWLAFFVGGGTLANVALSRFALGVLSDAPFCALLMLHLASLLAVIRRPTTARWPALSLTLAGAVLVRPAGLSLLVPLSLVLLRQPRSAILPAVVPTVSLWLFAAAINLVWRGTFALQEFAGTSLLLHVDPLIEAPADGKHPQLVRRLAEDLRRGARRSLGGAGRKRPCCSAPWNGAPCSTSRASGSRSTWTSAAPSPWASPACLAWQP